MTAATKAVLPPKSEEPLPSLVAAANVDELAWQALESEDSGSLVTNAERGYVYTWLRPADHPPDGRQIEHERQKLLMRGWEPCSGPLRQGQPGREFVANRPELEIWRVTQARYDNEWRVDMARSVLDRRYADRYYRWCERGNKKGGLPPRLAEAMYAFHGLMKIPGKPAPPTRDQLIAMVRRMPVHPGVEVIEDAW